MASPRASSKSKKLTIRSALLIIGLSTLVISGTTYAICFGYWKWKEGKLSDPKYIITSIIQTGPQKEKLPFSYLAELLSLSKDKPTSLYGFSCKKAEEKLSHSPFIQKAKVSKIFPKSIYVDLTLRKPIAKVYDFQGYVIDKEGVLFPALKEENLTEIFFGLPKKEKKIFGKKLEGKKWQIYKDLKMLLDHYPFLQMKRIDLSRALNRSLGKREIILLLSDQLDMDMLGKQVTLHFPKYLRMGHKNYSQQLANFLVLRERIHQDYRKQVRRLGQLSQEITFAPKVIDMRIGELAFVEK